MQKVSSIPLLFLFIGSVLGVFLRLQFILPTAGTSYSFFLHGHSHIMFLGWIFNALYIGFTVNHVVIEEQNFFLRLFFVLQVFVVGMLVSFPIQGYGFFSILFSTLHTFAAIIFVIKFFKRTRYVKTTSAWFARIALVFFTISTAGPFCLGYLMAVGMGQSNWYYFAIYFYLHFQYNGLFMFGIFSLIFNLIERKKIQFSFRQAKMVGGALAAACIPAYFLSILWAKPGLGFNILGGAAALVQIIALLILIKLVIAIRIELRGKFSRSSNVFLIVALAAFILKLILQLLSAFPSIAQMAYELRPVVIAYLHLVMLGVISLSLFVWYLESELINRYKGISVIGLYLISFFGLEICLILAPWWRTFFGQTFYSVDEVTLFFSVLLSSSCFGLYIFSLRNKTDKNQYLD
jgi:hypothetical protein